MQISNGELIWNFSGISFRAYGRATQFYANLLASRVSGWQMFDFTYEQWVELICLTFSPVRHSTPLTADILEKMEPSVFSDCKKKLQESLNWSQMYEDIISMSEALGKGLPKDMMNSKEPPVA